MPRKYENLPIDELRRKDRGADEMFIKKTLIQAPFCSIGNLLKDQPFIHYNTFVYVEKEKAIYFHTASEGRTRFNIKKNNKVCLSVAKMGRLLPAEVALEFSVEYESVVVFGEVSIVEDREEAKKILQKLLNKYFGHLTPGMDYRSTTDEELRRTTVYRIKISKWTGKQKLEAADFPGAFYYGDKNVS